MAVLYRMVLFTAICAYCLVMCVTGQNTDGLLDCSAKPQDGRTPFRFGQFIILECQWMDLNIPSNLVSNSSTIETPIGGSGTTTSDGRGGVTTPPQRPELGWFRREPSGNLHELSASHSMIVKWRLAADDNGVQFICAPTNGSQILPSPTCTQVPLAVPPEVAISSSPGTHVIGESNTFSCDAQGMPDIATYEWFVNGVPVYPEHDPRFSSGDSHIVVDDETGHRHGHITIDSLNITDNGTLISCKAWTTTNITNNASIVLILTESKAKKSSFWEDSVVLIACLSAGGAPLLFLICVCMIWGIRRSLRKRRDDYEINYSGSFKSEENIPAATETETNHASISRRFQSNTSHSNSVNRGGHGTVAAAVQRPNFFRQKLNRISQMFFTPTRYVDDESIYENTTPSQTTTMSTFSSLNRGGEIVRGGSLQLPHRPPLTKSMSTPSTPMSAPLFSINRDTGPGPDQDYENFVPPKRDYENTPSILESPSSPTW